MVGGDAAGLRMEGGREIDGHQMTHRESAYIKYLLTYLHTHSRPACLVLRCMRGGNALCTGEGSVWAGGLGWGCGCKEADGDGNWSFVSGWRSDDGW